MRNILTLCVTAAAALAGGAELTTARATSAPIVLELFTSEGCSSCPPADQLLGELIESPPAKGIAVIGLSEHVDYWDNLGWRDPFSNALFTKRQSLFARDASADGVYTPQIVVNGEVAVVGSDRAAVKSAIAKTAARPLTEIDLAWKSAKQLTVDVRSGSAAKGDVVLLAVTQDAASNVVTRGENQGHTLAHVNVTRRLSAIGSIGPTGGFHGDVTVPVDASWNASALHAVVLVQHGEGGAIRAAGRIGIDLAGR